MPKFVYIVEVETDTELHADQVMCERIYFEEELYDEGGNTFDYTIDWQHSGGNTAFS